MFGGHDTNLTDRPAAGLRRCGFETTVQQRPCRGVPGNPRKQADPLGATVRLAQPLARAFAGLGDQDQREVSGHQAKGSDRNDVTTLFGHQILVGLVVCIAENRLLAPVSPMHHMMRQPGHHNP